MRVGRGVLGDLKVMRLESAVNVLELHLAEPIVLNTARGSHCHHKADAKEERLADLINQARQSIKYNEVLRKDNI